MPRRTLPLLVLACLLGAGAWLIASRDARPHLPAEPAPPPRAAEKAASPESPPTGEPEPNRPAGGGFTGTVRRGGRPCAARIEIVRTGDALENFAGIDDPADYVEVARAGPDGRWRARGLPCGKYRIRATDDEGRTATVLSRFTPDSRFPHVDLVIPDGKLAFTGRAVWTDGTPFRGRVGAWLVGETGYDYDRRPAIEAGPDGEFRIEGLPPGLVRPVARIPGELVVVGAARRLPREAEVVFVVDEGMTRVSGRVVADEDGRPVAGAELWASEYGEGSCLGKRRRFQHLARSDAAGALATWRELLPATVEAEGFAPGRIEPPADGEDFEVRLERTGAIAGRVVSAETGEPVAAVVWADRVSTRAGADGRFRIEGIAPGRPTVFVYGGGYASPEIRIYRETSLAALEVEVEGGATTEVERTAEETGFVRGRALGEDGTPVEGASVSLFRAWRFPRDHFGTWWSVHKADDGDLATAGADGSFRLSGLLPGLAYRLVAWSPDGTQAGGRPFTVGPGAVHEENVVFPPTDGTREVEILYPDDEPVAGAVLSGYRWGPVWTGPDGRATVGPVVDGKLAFSVRHDSHRYRGRDLELPETRDLATYRLPRGHVIGGVVLDAEGRLAANASITLRGQTTEGRHFEVAERTTDADGRFVVEGIPDLESGKIHANLRVDDGWLAAEAEVLPWREDLVLRLGARPATGPERASVPVSGPDGEPVRGGRARIWTAPAGAGTRASSRNAWLAEGECRFWTPPPRGLLWVEVHGAGPRDAPFGPGLLGPLEPSDLRDPPGLVLPEGVEIEGRVTDGAGEPVPAVEVRATPLWPGLEVDPSRGTTPHAIATTFAAGTFRLSGLGRIPYRLDLNTPEGFAVPDPLTVTGGTKAVEIRLERPVTGVVTVTTADGRETDAAVRVIVYRADGTLVTSGRREGTGVVELPGLAVATAYRLVVWAGSERESFFPETVPSWTPGNTTVALRRVFAISGVVLGAGGRPARDVWVAHRADPEGRWRRVRVVADGRFEIRGLEAGAVSLKPLPPGRSAEDPGLPVVTVAAGEEGVRLVLPE